MPKALRTKIIRHTVKAQALGQTGDSRFIHFNVFQSNDKVIAAMTALAQFSGISFLRQNF